MREICLVDINLSRSDFICRGDEIRIHTVVCTNIPVNLALKPQRSKPFFSIKTNSSVVSSVKNENLRREKRPGDKVELLNPVTKITVYLTITS